MGSIAGQANTGGGTKSGSPFIPVKVMNIILDINDPLSEGRGGFDALGTISYIKINDIINNPTWEDPEKGLKIENMMTAKPLFSNFKYYPLKGEVVLLLDTTGRDIDKDIKASYYFPSHINIWNSIHHNAIPNVEAYKGKAEVKADYPKIGGGLVRHVKDGATDIPVGKYFKEQLNIKSLLPYEGDHILEGRFGNSIRFGSTAISKEGFIPDQSISPWSTIGNTGDPIIIIRNGQDPGADEQGWVPIIENINKDNSSIYLTSNQKINNFQVSSDNWASWNAVVEPPKDQQAKITEQEQKEEVQVADTTVAEETTTVEESQALDNTTNTGAEEEVEPVKVESEADEDLDLLDELLESGDFVEDDFGSEDVPASESTEATETEEQENIDGGNEETKDEETTVTPGSNGPSTSRSIDALHPAVKDAWLRVLPELESKGWKPQVVTAFRSLEDQNKKVQQKRSTVTFGKHGAMDKDGNRASQAMDVIDSRYSYGNNKKSIAAIGEKATMDLAFLFWGDMAAIGKKYGFSWGGDAPFSWKGNKYRKDGTYDPNAAKVNTYKKPSNTHIGWDPGHIQMFGKNGTPSSGQILQNASIALGRNITSRGNNMA